LTSLRHFDSAQRPKQFEINFASLVLASPSSFAPQPFEQARWRSAWRQFILAARQSQIAASALAPLEEVGFDPLAFFLAPLRQLRVRSAMTKKN
jgi:hypothetical protein